VSQSITILVLAKGPAGLASCCRSEKCSIEIASFAIVAAYLRHPKRLRIAGDGAKLTTLEVPP
jgi:hypothetical protein